MLCFTLFPQQWFAQAITANYSTTVLLGLFRVGRGRVGSVAGSVSTQCTHWYTRYSSGMLIHVNIRVPDELSSLFFPDRDPVVRENVAWLQKIPLLAV